MWLSCIKWLRNLLQWHLFIERDKNVLTASESDRLMEGHIS